MTEKQIKESEGTITSMGDNEGNVEATLKQRGSVYGSYDKVCSSRVRIMNILKCHYFTVNKKEMSEEIAMGFSDIVLKLVRAAGKPSYADSFHDLAGYATLMEKRAIEENTRLLN